MYAKILIGNFRKNVRDYGVFFFTIALSAAVFYAFNTISLQAAFLSDSISEVFQLMGEMLTGLTIGLAIILGFLMVYANNFLVKRRKKEFGLYELLGMRRSTVSFMMTGETLFCFIAAFATGIALGVVISQFLIFISAALFQNAISNFHFIFSWDALRLVAICFAITFCVTVILNLLSLKKINLEKLLKGGRFNEEMHLRKGWVSILVGGASLALIIVACVRLTLQGFPLSAMNSGDKASLWNFLATTAMMIVGVYGFLFAGPSLFVLIATKMKKFYYHGLHMFTIRQVASRITSNSFSMGTVCLVLFLAITSVSTGMGIAIATSQDLARTVPFTATLSGTLKGESGTEEILPPAEGGFIPHVAELLKEHDCNVSEYGTQANQVNLFMEPALAKAYQKALAQFKSGKKETEINEVDANAPMLENFCRYGEREDVDRILSSSSNLSIHPLQIESVSSYNATCQLLDAQPITLEKGEYVLAANSGGDAFKSILQSALDQGCPVIVAGTTLHPHKGKVISDKTAALSNMSLGGNMGTLIVSDEIAQKCSPWSFSLQLATPPNQSEAFQKYLVDKENTYHAAHDSDDESDNFRTFKNSPAYISLITTQIETIKGAQSMTGIIGYLAAYIGFVLVMSVAAIVAIQMLTTVSDSSRRYRVLSDLGTSHRMLNGTLISQILFYFLTPLVIGIALATVALVQIQKVASIVLPFDLLQSCTVAALVFLSVYALYLLICYLISRETISRAIS